MMDEIKRLRMPLEARLPEGVLDIIGQTIGEASKCWTDVDHAGTFKVEDARILAFELGHYIADLLDEAREEAGDDEAGYITGKGASLKRPMLLLQIIERIKAGGGK